ncbi:MAG: polynucleotide adenylyltransferase, partial [Oscillospiraceae bacterium]
MDFPTRIILPETVRKALDQLADKGFLSYIVGGCVRDSFLGKTPSDWDLCTSAVPDEIRSVFSDF